MTNSTDSYKWMGKFEPQAMVHILLIPILRYRDLHNLIGVSWYTSWMNKVYIIIIIINKAKAQWSKYEHYIYILKTWSMFGPSWVSDHNLDLQPVYTRPDVILLIDEVSLIMQQW